MAVTGVNYQGTVLNNAPTIYQAPLTIGNGGGGLTVQSGVQATFAGTTTIAGQANVGGANAGYALSALNPSDIGLKAWSFPTDAATGSPSALAIIGSVYLTTTHLAAGVGYGTIFLKVQSNAGTATAGQCFAGLYNSAGSLVATTADISGALGTALGTTGYIACPLTGTYTPTTGGQHWVGAFFNASNAGSFPGLYTRSGFATVATSAGTTVTGIAGPLGTQPYPYAVVATTSATALPGTFPLGSAGTAGAFVYWAGLA